MTTSIALSRARLAGGLPLSRTILALGLLLGGASFLVPIHAADASKLDETLRREFSVAAGGRLVIQADRGNVVVAGGDAGTAKFEVIRKIRSGAEDRRSEILENHEVEFSQDGNVVRLDSRTGNPNRRFWNWRGSDLNVEIRVSVPRTFDVEVQTAGGSIRANRLEGKHRLRTSGGAVHVEEVSGTVSATTSGGSIKALKVAGDVELTTSGGGITADGVAGQRLKANTAGGSIQLRGIAVPAEAHTSGGSITVETSATPLVAATAGGSVNATLTASPQAEANLKTSGGSVSLTLPGDAKFHLDAATTAGSVKSDFPVAVTSSSVGIRSKLDGPVNGGGPTLRLRTTAGSIRVKKS